MKTGYAWLARDVLLRTLRRLSEENSNSYFHQTYLAHAAPQDCDRYGGISGIDIQELLREPIARGEVKTILVPNVFGHKPKLLYRHALNDDFIDGAGI